MSNPAQGMAISTIHLPFSTVVATRAPLFHWMLDTTPPCTHSRSPSTPRELTTN
jgi:hypothetical protein